MESVITKDAARKELDKWLDFHEITEDQRNDMSTNIGIIVAAMTAGRVVINVDCSLKQILKHPFGKEKTVSELLYKASGLAIGEVESMKTSVPAEYDNRNALGHIAVATDKPIDVLLKMSSKDLNTALAIVVFFIV